MHEIPETYELERVDQLKAIADERRQRMLTLLTEAPLTVTQVGERLGIAPAKAHYHVRELERVGLVRLVETRERGGILEKYYRAIARDIGVPRTLLRGIPPEESMAAVTDMAAEIQQGFMRALSNSLGNLGSEASPVALSRMHLWLTDLEFSEVMNAIDDALRPYQQPRGIEGERQRTFAQVMYDTELGAAMDTDEETLPSPHVERTVAVGSFAYSRQDLERIEQRNQRIDLTALGYLHFSDDIPASLVERIVVRFRHKGMLKASPAVRAVLERKRGRV